MSKPESNTTGFPNQTWIESAAVSAYKVAVSLNDTLEDNLVLLISTAVALVSILVAIAVFGRLWATSGKSLKLSPQERKELEELNVIAKARAAAFVERHVVGGVNHDAFYRKDARVPPALAAATNRFALQGRASADDDDDDDDDAASGGIAAVMARIQSRDDDGSEQPVAVLVVADDASVPAESQGAATATKCLQAHTGAKKLASALDSAGFLTCTLSTLGDNYPYQKSCGSVLKQMQLADRKFRASLLYICGRARLFALPKWPKETQLETERGRKALVQRSGHVGRDADYIFEVLIDPAAPDAPTSWVDVAVLVCRLAAVADTPFRPSAILNLVWESDADRKRALEARTDRSTFGEASDPDGFLAALDAGCPEGALAGVSVLAASRTVSEAKSDAKKSGDVVAAVLADGIKAGTASANRSAALGLAIGPATRTLAEESPVHCGAITMESIAEFLQQAGRRPGASAIATAMPPIAVCLGTSTPPALAVQAVAGPRGGLGLPVSAASKEFGDDLDAAATKILAAQTDDSVAGPKSMVLRIEGSDVPSYVSRQVLRQVAWLPALAGGIEDHTFIVQPPATGPTGDAAATMNVVLARCLEYLLGPARRPSDAASLRSLFGKAFAGLRSTVVVDVDGDDTVRALVAEVSSLRREWNPEETGPVFVFAVASSSSSVASGLQEAEAATVLPVSPLAITTDHPVCRATKIASSRVGSLDIEALRLLRGATEPVLAACRQGADELSSARVMQEVAAHLSCVEQETLHAVCAASALFAKLGLPLYCNSFCSWAARGVLKLTADQLKDADADATFPKLALDPALAVATYPPLLQTAVASLLRKRVLVLDADMLSVVIHPTALAATWCAAQSPSCCDAAALIKRAGSPHAVMLKCMSLGGAIGPGIKSGPGPKWVRAASDDPALLPHIVRVLPDGDAAAPEIGLFTIGAVLNSTAFLRAAPIDELVMALRLRRVDAATVDTLKLAGATADAIDVVLKTLGSAADVIHAAPSEAMFQLATRMPIVREPRLVPDDFALVGYAFRGDDNAADRLSGGLDYAVPVATTCDPSGPIMHAALDRNAEPEPADGDEHDAPLTDRAITSSSVVRDPATGKYFLVAGTHGGDLLLVGDAAAAGCVIALGAGEGGGGDAAVASFSPSAAPARIDLTKATRIAASGPSPHKAPIVAIFLHSFADGESRLVSASKADRTIAVWPAVDLAALPESARTPKEVLSVLPPPAPLKGLPDDDDEDTQEDAPPKNRRPYVGCSVARAYVSEGLLLHDRLPDRFDYTAVGSGYGASQGRKGTKTDVVRGDAVLLHAGDDQLNERTFHGERAQPHFASFTFLVGAPAQGRGAVTAAAVTELPASDMIGVPGPLPKARGFYGLIVGDATGGLNVFALGAPRLDNGTSHQGQSLKVAASIEEM